MNTQQALQLAFQHLNSGNLEAARQLFNGILQQAPNNFAALNGRGFVALQQNALPKARADFQASLAINPKQPFAHKMLGIVQGAMGRFDESMLAFDAALNLDAKDPEVYFNRSNFLIQIGHAQEALADLDAAIKLKASYLEARSNRANLLIQMGEFSRAEKDLAYLTDKIKVNPDLWVALGFVRYKLGRYQEAFLANGRALEINTQHPDALMNNSSIAFELLDYSGAVSWAEKSLVVTPNRAESHYSRAKALAELARFDEALCAYDKAIALNAQYAEAFMGRGLVRAGLREVSAAIADYDEALRLRPDYIDALYNKSYMQLEQQDFEHAWSGYELRLGFPKYKDSLLPNLPLWDGEKTSGLLLVRGEQGLGDQILFSSVLQDLISQGIEVCLQIEPRLVDLFKRSFPGIEVFPKSNVVPQGVVAQIPLGSLPKYFRQTKEVFVTAKGSYLKADEDKTLAFRNVLAPNGERIIGLNWRSFNNKYANEKSMGLLDMAPFFNLSGCTVVNLQYGDVKDEMLMAEAAGLHFNESVTIELTKDIDGVASLINACDVIVSVSNSTAHIAGALGKRVALMLPYRVGKFWYWSESSGERSLWYPSIRTFHQDAQGDWASTIRAVKEALVEKA